MTLPRRGRGDVMLTLSAPAGELTVRSGGEAVGLTEVLYVRLVVIVLHGLVMVSAGAVVIAFVRTSEANFARTTALAVLVALLAVVALRARVRVYRAMRRRPLLSLAPPLLALAALIVDGVSHSPISYIAAVCVAMTGFVSGRGWALAAATLVSVGAVTAAMLRIGPGALDSVGQGTSGYFVWALVSSGLAEAFVRMTMRLSRIPPATNDDQGPLRVRNLAGDAAIASATPTSSRQSSESGEGAPPRAASCLTARQLQVVVLLADGLQADAIALRLGISTSTVYRYVERAKERAGVMTRSELVSLAVRERIVPAAETAAASTDPANA